MAGETQNYHETRDPYFASAGFASVSPITTSVSLVPILRVPATNLAFPANYWLKPGRRWLVRMFGLFTTAATPGNLTLEVRHQTGTPTDAGGTILCTSAAIALAASKSNISWEMEIWIESRGDATTFVPTASPLGCQGRFIYDGAGALFSTTSQNPLLLPATLGTTQTNVDCTLAGTIHVDAKRSGSTAEAATVTDLSVNALT